MRCRILSYVPLTLGALLTTACATLNPESVTLPPPADTRVATKVKAQLIEDENVSAAAILATSRSGTVTLDGFVDNAGQKRRAEELARGVAGVTGVANELQVR